MKLHREMSQVLTDKFAKILSLRLEKIILMSDSEEEKPKNKDEEEEESFGMLNLCKFISNCNCRFKNIYSLSLL